MTASVGNTYFAEDGSYGDATDLVLTDTSSWTSSMWDVVENSTDSQRQQLAEHFVLGEHHFDTIEDDFDGNHKVCDTCRLPIESLN